MDEIIQDGSYKGTLAWPDSVFGYADLLEKVRKGTLVTERSGSDRTPYEVVAIEKDHDFVVVRDVAWQVVEGSEEDGSAKYKYFHKLEGHLRILTLRKSRGYLFYAETTARTSEGARWSFGSARRYYNPHF